MMRAPGPKVHPVFNVLPARYRYRIGLAGQHLRDPLDLFSRCAREYGGIVCLSPERVHVVSDPVYVKHVMQDNHDPGHSVSRKLLVTLTCDSLWLRLSSRPAMEARVGV